MRQQLNKRKKEKGGRDSTYEEAFKIAIAKEYFKGELGYMKLASKYKLPDASTVRYFVNWYKANYDLTPGIATAGSTPDIRSGKGGIEPAQPSSPSPTKTEAALLKELEEARLKITALETMISIARTDFGIDILKKSGAKQSKS